MKHPLEMLFIDDEADFLETTVKRLTRRGYSARGALNWEEALQILETTSPDIVVLDVFMPGKNGILCLHEIKERWPRMPVILLTGHASIQTGLNGLGQGASDYCLKPIELDELLEKIRIACREAA